LYCRIESARGTGRTERPGGSLRNELDLIFLLPSFRPFLSLLEQHAPAPLAAAARELSAHDTQASAKLLNDWWSQLPGSAGAAGDTPGVSAAENECVRFCTRAFLEPYAEYLAKHTEPPVIEFTPRVCPLCGSRPLLGVLRPEGDGGKRFLLCSFCLQEWEFRRILCAHCGEEREQQLPVYVAEQFPHIRVECCETCKYFLRTIDLTKDGNAVPIVDDLAAIPLSLWAEENGYKRIQGNLLGT
jgi:formate dehydrogenase accessory protein FdhE